MLFFLKPAYKHVLIEEQGRSLFMITNQHNRVKLLCQVIVEFMAYVSLDTSSEVKEGVLVSFLTVNMKNIKEIIEGKKR